MYKNITMINILFLILLFLSCSKNKLSEKYYNIDFNTFSKDYYNGYFPENFEEHEVVLLNTDYEIIYYLENVEGFLKNKRLVKKYIEIEIVNVDIFNKLNNTYNPMIHIEDNNMFLAKGHLKHELSIPADCNFYFYLDINNKIEFIEGKIIALISYYIFE